MILRRRQSILAPNLSADNKDVAADYSEWTISMKINKNNRYELVKIQGRTLTNQSCKLYPKRQIQRNDQITIIPQKKTTPKQSTTKQT